MNRHVERQRFLTAAANARLLFRDACTPHGRNHFRWYHMTMINSVRALRRARELPNPEPEG